MSDSSVVGVLAEALAQHQLNNWWEVSKPDGKRVSCSCKWVHESDGLFGWESGRDARAIHRAHVASVVAALPNIRIVDLVAERAEAASRDARRHLSEMRCINGVAGYYCNVTYAERDQYYCEYAAKGLTHYFDTPEHIAELEARASGGQA